MQRQIEIVNVLLGKKKERHPNTFYQISYQWFNIYDRVNSEIWLCICWTLSNFNELFARFVSNYILQNLVNINATHVVPFRTEHIQMSQFLAHCGSLLILDQLPSPTITNHQSIKDMCGRLISAIFDWVLRRFRHTDVAVLIDSAVMRDEPTAW